MQKKARATGSEMEMAYGGEVKKNQTKGRLNCPDLCHVTWGRRLKGTGGEAPSAKKENKKEPNRLQKKRLVKRKRKGDRGVRVTHSHTHYGPQLPQVARCVKPIQLGPKFVVWGGYLHIPMAFAHANNTL